MEWEYRMNRRQKKKAFKKKHGINPQIVTFTAEIDWTGVAESLIDLGTRFRETLHYITRAAIPQLGLDLQILASALTEGMKILIDKVKNMSDEEWETFKEELTEEQIKIAERIRAHEQSNIDGQTH